MDAREGFDKREVDPPAVRRKKPLRNPRPVDYKSLHIFYRQHRDVAELAFREPQQVRCRYSGWLEGCEDPVLARDVVRGGEQMTQWRASQHATTAVGIGHELCQVRVAVPDPGATQGRTRTEAEREKQ